jgi:hypothetical protein
MTTIELIKSYTDNDVWKIACACNKCIGIDWIEAPVEQFAKLLDAWKVDIRDTKAFNKFSHNMLQATKI